MTDVKLVGARSFVWVVAVAWCGFCVTAGAEKNADARDLHAKLQTPNTQTVANQQAEAEADLLVAHGQYAAAIEKYQQMNSQDAHVLNKLGVAYEYLGGMQKARGDYEEAIRLDPTLSVAYNNLATIYYAEHGNGKAEKFYKKAIKLDSRNASAYKNLGTLYFVRRKFHKGAEMYQEAIRIEPDIFVRNRSINVSQFDKELLGEMNFFLAELCARNGQTVAAMAYLRKALDAGFHDQTRLETDQALASVRMLPAFGDLLQK